MPSIKAQAINIPNISHSPSALLRNASTDSVPRQIIGARVTDDYDNDDASDILSPVLDLTEEESLFFPVIPVVEGAGGLPISGEGENSFIKFQLIPISETPGKSAVGEVTERSLKEKDTIKIGRQVIKDGQATIKGNKKATEQDIWFTSKVVSRLHAEIWTKDGQLCVKDVGSSSGTFLNQMRLSPSGKESRPYPLRQGDVLQFGVDFKGKTEDVYRAITMKLGFHDQSWLKSQRKNANGPKFSAALKQLIAATNPYAETKGTDDEESGDTDCCICIGAIAPFQALFIAPCSHCYHYKCVSYLLSQSPMFQCPLCRQVANLTASVSSESLNAGAAKITIPLPKLEDELPKKIEEPIPAKNKRASFSGVKRIMDNLGLLSPRSDKNNQESPDNQPPSPAVGPSNVQSRRCESSSSAGPLKSEKQSKARTSLSFRFKFGKNSEKGKDSAPDSVPASTPTSEGEQIVAPSRPSDLNDVQEPAAQYEHFENQ